MAKTFTLNQVDFLKDPAKAILFEEFLRTHSYDEDKIKEVIYKSNPGDFLGESPVIITNEKNLLTRSCYTTAKYESGEILTSDNVVKVIGQSNYNKVFTALCSILSQEWRVKSILALLTKSTVHTSIQTSCDNPPPDNSFTAFSEPQAISMDRRHPETQNIQAFKKEVVSEPLNSLAEPSDSLDTPQLYETNDNHVAQRSPSWHTDNLLRDIEDISSNMSFSFSNITNEEFNQDALLKDIDDNTDRGCALKVLNKHIVLPFIPKDKFHFASPEILSKMTNKEHIKLLWMHQNVIDYKYCMEADEDDMLPIHHAVLERDAATAGRLGVVLRNKAGCVDARADGHTPLHLALKTGSVEVVQILLAQAASVSLPDPRERNALHLAAEAGDAALLDALSQHCEDNQSYVREELTQHWCHEDSNLSPSELKATLMKHLGSQYDNQGCTPLMLACRGGHPAATSALLALAPAAVDYRSPKSGETALFQTVTNACLDASQRGKNEKISEAYMKTVQLLLEAGAKPDLANFSGTTISQILSTDYNYPQLTMLIFNRQFYKKYNETIPSEELNKLMLVKVNGGKVKLTEVNNDKAKNSTSPKKVYSNNNKIPIKAKPIDSLKTSELKNKKFNIIFKQRQTRQIIPKVVDDKTKDTPAVQSVERFVKIAPKPNVSESIRIDPVPKDCNQMSSASTSNIAPTLSLPIIVTPNLAKPVLSGKRISKLRKVGIKPITSQQKKPIVEPLNKTESLKFVKILPNPSLSTDNKVTNPTAPKLLRPLRIERKLIPFDKDKYVAGIKRKQSDLSADNLVHIVKVTKR